MKRSLVAVFFLVAVAAGCTCGNDPGTVKTPGILEVDKASTGVDFGMVRLNEVKKVDLTLFNRGRSKLKVVAIDRVGADGQSLSSAFRVGSLAQSDIAADGQAKLTLTFAPDTAGQVGGEIVLRTDSDEKPEVHVKVAGQGVETKIDVTPLTVDFGLAEVDSRSAQTVKVRNDGLIAEDIVVSALPDGSPHFEVGPIPGDGNVMHLDPGATAELPVAFSPKFADRIGFSSSIDLKPCDNCDVITVTLKGAGVESFLDVKPKAPACLDFGLVNPGASLTKDILVSNVGTRALTLLQAALAQPGGKFTLAGTFPQGIPAGESAKISVTYSPTGLTNDAGTVVVTSDDPKASSINVCVRGVGGGADVTVQPASLDFGTVAVGVPRTRTVRIANAGQGSGGNDLLVSRVAVAGSPEFTADFTQPFSIPVGGSRLVTVTYSPANDGADQANLVVETSDTDTPSFSVSLAGKGRALPPCSLEITPASGTLAFGNVSRNLTASLPFALKNTGDSDCLVDTLQLSAATDPAFTLAAGGIQETVLAAGQTKSILVSFKPTQAKSYTGQVSFNVSDPTTPTRTLQLTGLSAQGCLLIAPNEVDFGTVGAACASREKVINVYNTCSTNVKVTSIGLAAQVTPVFETIGLPTLPMTVTGATTLSFRLRYLPQDVGHDNGGVFLKSDERAEPYLVTLEGQATLDAVQHDTFHQDRRPKVDLLFIADNSGSMGPYQAALAQNFSAFMTYANQQQVDYHIAVTTTDTDSSGQKGHFVPTQNPPPRPRVITPMTPNRDAVFADNINVGSSGSSTERGFEGAYEALQSNLLAGDNAGFLRDDALLSIIVVSDEEEQSSPALSFYFNFFMNIKGARRANLFNWSSVVQIDPAAGIDYGARYIEMTRRTGGILTSVKTQNWAADLQKLGQVAFGYKTRFFLTSTPEDPTAIEVKIDGDVIPAKQGNITNWTFDPIANAVDFSVISVPEPGTTLEIAYKVACGH